MARRTRNPRTRGWYEKQGDPPGTERFWDGDKWGPQPRYKRGHEPQEDKQAKGAQAGETTPATPATSADGELHQATLWTRISARSADMVLVMLPWYFIYVQAFPTEEVETAEGLVTQAAETQLQYAWLAVALVLVYEVGFTAWWGATPGKRLLALKIVDRVNLEKPTVGRSILRATPLLLVVTMLLAPILWLVCVVLMWRDRAQRSLFDLSGGTVVVVDPERESRLAPRPR